MSLVTWAIRSNEGTWYTGEENVWSDKKEYRLEFDKKDIAAITRRIRMAESPSKLIRVTRKCTKAAWLDAQDLGRVAMNLDDLVLQTADAQHVRGACIDAIVKHVRQLLRG